MVVVASISSMCPVMHAAGRSDVMNLCAVAGFPNAPASVAAVGRVEASPGCRPGSACPSRNWASNAHHAAGQWDHRRTSLGPGRRVRSAATSIEAPPWRDIWRPVRLVRLVVDGAAHSRHRGWARSSPPLHPGIATSATTAHFRRRSRQCRVSHSGRALHRAASWPGKRYTCPPRSTGTRGHRQISKSAWPFSYMALPWSSVMGRDTHAILSS